MMPYLKVGEDQHLPKSECLSCGKQLDAANNVDVDPTAKAEPGCITICLGCGYVMAFADDMSMRELTAEEAYEVAGNKTILAIQEARSKVVKERKQ